MMKRNAERTIRRLVGLLAIAIVAVGCTAGAEDGDAVPEDGGEASEATDDGEDTGEETVASPDDQHGLADELVIAIDGESPTLARPWAYKADQGLVMRNVLESLIERDAETADFIPGLATEWEQVDDLTWRFQLRENVEFHDGSPFNAEAAAFSFNDTFSEENADDPPYVPVQGRLGGNLPEAVVVDEFTIDISTESPQPVLLSHISSAPISSMEQLEERPETFESEPIGTGPYRFVEWNRGSSYTLEVNEDWWGWESEEIQQKPSYAKVTFLVRPEVSSRIAAVRAGEADFAWDLPVDECQSELGDNCVQAPNPTTSLVRIDTPHPTLGDPRVKEALAISIDRVGIGEALFGGAPPASQLDVEGALGFNDQIEPFEYNPERAEELLDEARADGVDLDIEIELYGREGSFVGDRQLLEVLQNTWSDLGLNINAQMLDIASYNDIWVGGPANYEEGRSAIFMIRLDNDLFDAARMFSITLDCEGLINIECIEDLDERYREAMGLPPEERQAAFEEIQRDAYADVENLVFVPINELRLFHGVGDDVEWEPRPDVFVFAREFSPAS